jgi:type I restriction enzyme S subunit
VITRRLIQVAQVDLGRQRAPEHERGDHIVPYLRSANVGDGRLILDDVKSMNFTPKEQDFFSLRAGDVLVTEGSGSKETVGAAAVFNDEIPAPVCFQNTLLRIRPREGLSDGTFLYWWMRHAHASGMVAAVTTGANIQHLGAESLRGMPILIPSIEAQRRVADFLSDHIARIDFATRLREQQIETLEDRANCVADLCLMQRGWSEPQTLEAEALYPLPDGWRAARLSQVLRQLTNGYVGPTRDILVDEGVRYIQGMHIKDGEIDFDRRHFYVTPEWHAERPRIHLRAGDVLVVQTGDIGKVAVVPPDFGEASCHALQILRVRPEFVSGDYLAAYLSSSFGYHSLLSRATGALHPHLEGGIRSVPVVLPPLEVQTDIVEEVTEIRRSIRQAQAVMREQVALLQERKRSLITAAVTGEFDVSATSG